ncbi:MAG: hypothetical protein KKA79_03415 [Nanoarchaeota archaeon]|nr:hypothetical protein [Nanoarchaeota archaeon]
MRRIRWIKIIKYSPYIVLVAGAGFLISFLILSYYIQTEEGTVTIVMVVGGAMIGMIATVFAFLSMLARLYG